MIDNTERYMIDDAGTLIDKKTCTCYDYLEKILPILNQQEARIKELETENNQLKREKERYKLLSEIRDENINNRILSLKEFINNCEDEKVKNVLEDLFYSEVKEYDLAKENRKLKQKNEELKRYITRNTINIIGIDLDYNDDND